MYKLINLIIITCFLAFYSCSKQTKAVKLTDDEFYKSIPEDNYRLTAKKIDSLLEYGEHSNHRRGLLFLEKGRMLGLLEKDDEAIISLKKALYLLDKKNRKITATTYKLLGASYSYISERDTSIFKKDSAEYFTKKAHKIYKEIGHKIGEATALNILGHLSFSNDDFSTSALYVKKAIDIQLEIDDKNYLSSSYNNLAYILEQTEEYADAIKYYQKSVALDKEIDKQSSSSLRNLGSLYLLKNDLKKSKAAFKAALIIEEKTAQHIHQKEIYEGLIEVSIKSKDFPDLTSLITKKDSVTNLLASFENTEKIKLLNAEHNQFIFQENLKQELDLNKKNKFILIFALGVILLLGLFLYQKNRNTLLKQKQQTLELEQKMLRVQMNPHFIFNTLTAIQNKVFDNEPLKQISFIGRFAKLIRQNFDFVNQKEISLTEDIDALTNYIETQQLRFNDKFDYTINIDKNINTDGVKIPPMLLQIFVENAIEHGLGTAIDKGVLIININTKKDFVKFEIIDNGVGYTKQEAPEEHAIDIFKKRLLLRKLGEEKLFSIQSFGANLGTKVAFSINLAS